MLSCLQFQEMVQEYDTKHAIYFKLHQEIQDLSVKVEGLQQVIATSIDLFCSGLLSQAAVYSCVPCVC